MCEIKYITVGDTKVPYIAQYDELRWFSVGDVCKMLGFDTRSQRARCKKLVKSKCRGHMARVDDFTIDAHPWFDGGVLMISESTIKNTILTDIGIRIPVSRIERSHEFAKHFIDYPPSSAKQYRPMYEILCKMFQNPVIMADRGVFKIKFKLCDSGAWNVKFKGILTVIIANILLNYSLNHTIEEFSLKSDSGEVFRF